MNATIATAQADEAMPSREMLADFARRIARNPARTFTPEQLQTTLVLSARLTYHCHQFDNAAYRAWASNRNGSWHTQEARERAIQDAHDLADYAWDEARNDATRAHSFLIDPAVGVVTARDLLVRIANATHNTEVAA
ncbi:hypothetical protein [Streptomyces sp. NPDC060243]|uniref:hypothetical protein n=1 Tax=Streptomyces sp. NPDC060243 TaxID=3347081 RepID=UPI003663F51E